jgi:uncharacterized membrane protein YfcA
MVGLVLGVVRFPVIMTVEASVSIAAGTNLGVSTLGAITAAISHYRKRNIQFRPFLILGISGAFGALIASFFTGHFPIALLLIVLGLIVSYEALALFQSPRVTGKNKINTNDTVPVQSKNRLLFLQLLIGFGVGFLGGLVGLILGSVRMPAMISILKMEPKVAVGTNLAAASLMGISGFVGHLINNNIDYLILIAMGPAAMIGGYVGARYTNRFSDRNLKRLIALVLVVVAFTMFLRAFAALKG